jgi:hypothetical protein
MQQAELDATKANKGRKMEGGLNEMMMGALFADSNIT